MPALDQGAEMVHVLKTGSKATKARARKTGAPKGRKSAKTKRRIASSVTHHQAPSVADLQAQLEHRTTELDRALERQTATADILSVIASSPSDVQPVFEAIAESAARLCQAEFCNVFRFDGELIHFMHSYGYSREAIEALRHFYPMRPGRGSCAGRAILNEKVEQVPDVRADPEYVQGNVPDIMKISSILAVPMLKERRPVGAIAIVRAARGTFPQRQIDLLKTFADQAVIAIENARLFNETQKALEREAATAEILKVINNSPGDLAPVFDAILEKATLLCGASFSLLATYEGDDMHRFVAKRGVPPEFTDLFPGSVRLGPETGLGRLVRGESFVHIRELSDDLGYSLGNPVRRFLVDVAGARSYLAVPLRRDEVVLGSFTIYRREVRPFSGEFVALLQNFAAQAVIAIENARLFNETREALEQQTATVDILKVIASSPGDLTPVFDAMLENAMRLCEASHCHVWRFDGGLLHAVAVRGDPWFTEWLREHSPLAPIPGSAADRIARGDDIVRVDDRRDEEAYSSDPVFRGFVDASGVRTSLSVALRREGALLGMINVYRQEVRPFSDRQVALLQNFAAQAVVAMENARLFDEIQARTRDLEESLQQQIATANVLKVISR